MLSTLQPGRVLKRAVEKERCAVMRSALFLVTLAASLTCATPTGSFTFSDTTCKEDHLTFFVIGDWGIGGYDGYQATSRRLIAREETDHELDHELQVDRELGGGGGGKNKVYYQHQVAAAMDLHARTYCTPDALLLLGDNFYKKGVQSPTDAMWATHYEMVYHQYESLKVPAYSILGNHDIGFGLEVASYAQGQQRNMVDPLWMTKDTNYSVSWNIPNGGVMTGIFVDTQTLSPATNAWTNENSGISTTEQRRRISDQAEHLWQFYQDAKALNSQWIITYGHYPIYSAGDHGDNGYLKSNLLKFLEYFGCQAYVCGHDHINMHLQAGDIEFFVAGAGSMNDYVKSSSSANLLFAGEGYSAFVVQQVYKDKCVFSYVDTAGNIVYQYTLTNPVELVETPTENPTHAPTASDTVAATQQASTPLLKTSIWPTAISTASPSVKVGAAFGLILVFLAIAFSKTIFKKLRGRGSDGDVLPVIAGGTIVDEEYPSGATNGGWDERSVLSDNTFASSRSGWDRDEISVLTSSVASPRVSSPREEVHAAMHEAAITAFLGPTLPRSRAFTVSEGQVGGAPKRRPWAMEPLNLSPGKGRNNNAARDLLEYTLRNGDRSTYGHKAKAKSLGAVKRSPL